MVRIIVILEWIALVGVIIVLLVRLYRNRNREREAATWPRAAAIIQSAGLEYVHSGGRSPVERPCFAFSYVVNGEYYSGRFSLPGDDDRSATLIRELIDRKLTVKYDPQNPSDFRIVDTMIEGCNIGEPPIESQ